MMAKIPMVTPKRERIVRSRFDLSAFQAKPKLSKMSRKASMLANKREIIDLGCGIEK